MLNQRIIKVGLYMFKCFGLPAVIVCACVASGAEAAEIWSTEGFANPESVEYDPAHARYYVSNVDGDATAADGKGTLYVIVPMMNDNKVVSYSIE